MSKRNYVVDIDLNQNQLLNVSAQVLSADPGSSIAGQFWYRSNTSNGTGNGVLKYKDSSGNVITLGSGGGSSNAFSTITDGSTSTDASGADTITFAKTGAGLSVGVTGKTVTYTLGSLDQITAPAANLDLNSHKIINLSTPTSGNDAVNKSYVDGLVTNAVRYKGTVDATAADVNTATGTSTHLAGDMYRVTVSGNVAFGFQLNSGDFVVYNGATWNKIDNTDPSVAGTSNRIIVTPTSDTTYTVDISSSYVGQSTITTLGTITTGVWTGTTIAVANGGTGSTTAALARGTGGIGAASIPSAATNVSVAAAGIATMVKAVITGTGSATAFTVTHALGNATPLVQLFDASGNLTEAFIQATDTNNVVVTFNTAPGNTVVYNVIVMG